ncbi:plasmid pRiA4b ORF-3 family protein [Terrilactibacillus laevilacticus]|uniref:Plasmid pRiA4b ORF-3 family protein n=2 Tax=Terrilactibacillus laevilacticus TaxID=1380157 RepID=A0ABW5PUW9_9BACI
MIYQLKVTIRHMKPPVWRRVLVNGDTTFIELHKTIQSLFEWEDYHLHGFEVIRSNGETVSKKMIRIGTDDDQNEFFFLGARYDYDEKEEKINRWLNKEKDRLLYTYDYGDNWEHDIILEKVLPPEEDQTYPTCVKVKGAAPGEDSRGDWISGEVAMEEIVPNELVSEINERLVSLAKPVSIKQGKNNWGYLFKLANQFKQLEPWKVMSDNEVFVVELPDNQKVFCFVIGGINSEYGLSVFIGDEGLTTMTKIVSSGYTEEKIFEQRSLLLTFSDRSDLSNEDYKLIKKEQLTYRGKKQWPQFRSFEPGKYPWYLSDKEVEWFICILDQAIHVVQKVIAGFSLPLFGEPKLFARVVENQNETMVWKDDWMIIEDYSPVQRKKYHLMIDELQLERLKKSYRKKNQSYEVETILHRNPVQEHEGERPYFPIIFLALERKHGMIVFHKMMETNDDTGTQIQQTFMSMIESLQAIPREVFMTEKDYAVLRPLTTRLGISVLKVKHLTNIENVKRML